MDCHLPANAGDFGPGGSGTALSGHALAGSRPRALMPVGAAPAHLHQTAPARGMNRYRMHIGDLIVELRYFPRRAGIDYRIVERRALLLIPLNQDLEIVTETTCLTCPAEVPFLFTRDETATAVWHANAWALAIHLRRDRLNAATSAALGDARRLLSVAAILDSGDEDNALEPVVRRLIALITGSGLQQGPAALAFESNIYRGLAERLIAQQVNELAAPLRAVNEAMRIVRDNHSRSYDTEALAAAVGVTASTLRKGFRSSLGMSVKEYIQMVRLDWAQQTLASGVEARSIAEIARAAGFAESPPFSRAYMKRFGEPPSQTRARSVCALVD